MINAKNDNDITIFNLKLKRSCRRLFKEKARENHNCTMQEMLAIFVESYIKNPGMFNVNRCIEMVGDTNNE